MSENSYSRWLAVCFCHHYFNAKIVVLLATELSLKLASLAGWQAFSMSLVPFDSASLILDDSNTEMFLCAVLLPLNLPPVIIAFYVLNPFNVKQFVCNSFIHSFQLSMSEKGVEESQPLPPKIIWIICLDLNAESSNSKHSS